VLILALSSIPAPRIGPLVPGGWDKVAHALEYGVFSVLIARALRGAGPGRAAWSARGAALAAIVAAAAYGALDESYQPRAGRDADPFDLAADVAGAALAQAVMLRRERGGVKTP
jgi:VanZ family protein